MWEKGGKLHLYWGVKSKKKKEKKSNLFEYNKFEFI